MKKMIVGFMLAIGLVSGAVAGEPVKRETYNENVARILINNQFKEKYYAGSVLITNFMMRSGSSIMMCLKIPDGYGCDISLGMNEDELRQFAESVNMAVAAIDKYNAYNK